MYWPPYHQLLYRECLSQHICVRVYLGVGERSIEAKQSRPAKTQRFVKTLKCDAKNEHEEDSSLGGKVGDDPRSSSTANAVRAAAARASEDFVKCSHIDCDKSVPPSRRRRKTTCGKPTCGHKRNKK